MEHFHYTQKMRVHEICVNDFFCIIFKKIKGKSVMQQKEREKIQKCNNEDKFPRFKTRKV